MNQDAWGWAATFWLDRLPLAPDNENEDAPPPSHRRPRSFTPSQEERRD